MTSRRLAVLLGNSEFPEEPKLEDLLAPVNDVDNFAKVLSSESRGGFPNVSALKNYQSYEARREIQRTLNDAAKDDLVLFYYSGHGKLNRAGNLYLTTYDTVLSELESTAISVKSIRDMVDVSHSQRILLILDCCYSGAVGDAFAKGSVEEELQLASQHGRGTFIITASTGIQTAQEKEKDRQSVFTRHLVTGIESGEADENGDGFISADEIYNYVHEHVRNENHQEPTRWGIGVRGQFIISKSGRQPRKERAANLRKLLLKLASAHRISDDILAEAIRIINIPTDELAVTHAKHDALLQELLDKKLDSVNFVIKWIRISSGPLVEEPPSQPALEEKQARPEQERQMEQKPQVAKHSGLSTKERSGTIRHLDMDLVSVAIVVAKMAAVFFAAFLVVQVFINFTSM